MFISIVILFSGWLYSQDLASVLDQLNSQITASADGSDKIKEFTKTKLLALATNPVIVAEVKSQNAKKMSMDEIKKIDEEWSNAEDELPIQTEKMNNACAKELSSVVASNPMIAEIFVMDNQGGNVGQNRLTSDYWQGDEPKWQNVYNGGKGGILIDKEKLDKSTNIMTQQISVPVLDENGQVIGAICCGINVSML